MGDTTKPGCESVKQFIHNSSASSICHELAPKSDQTTGGDGKFHGNTSMAMILEIRHAASSARKFFGNNAHFIFRNIQEYFFHGFHCFSIFFMGDDMGFGHHEFVPFPAHGFNQNSHLEFSSSPNFKHISPFCWKDMKRDITQDFFLQSFVDMTRGEIFPIFSCEGSIVHVKQHGNSGFIHFDAWQGFWVFIGRNCVTDVDIFYSRHRDNIAGF